MIKIDLLFPEGRKKAVTFSYDDGVKSDLHIMEEADKYGIKCTFNINSEGETIPDLTLDESCRRLTADELKAVYSSSHEAAIHTLTHPYLKDIPVPTAVSEIINDRRNLERILHKPVLGLAYPFNSYNADILEALRLSGIRYARTTIPTNGYSLPDDWLQWNPTCGDIAPEADNLINRFIGETPICGAWLMYLWGHSYVYERKNCWKDFSDICKKLGNNPDIWYASNIEIYNYANAYKNLIFDVDCTFAYNPTPYRIWLEIRTDWVFDKSTVLAIEPGQQINLV